MKEKCCEKIEKFYILVLLSVINYRDKSWSRANGNIERREEVLLTGFYGHYPEDYRAFVCRIRMVSG